MKYIYIYIYILDMPGYADIYLLDVPEKNNGKKSLKK